MLNLGALAALGSSATWAFSSTRYAAASRAIGPSRVNIGRALIAAPVYITVGLILHRGRLFEGIDSARFGWLSMSTVCAYGLGDSIFFASARRLGISTALSIASSYPLWAALAGVVLGGESIGPLRIVGTLLCVAGVIALVALSRNAESSRPSPSPGGARKGDEDRRATLGGIAMAFLASLFWAGNSFSISRASLNIDVWQVNAIRYTMALFMLLPQAHFSPKPTGQVSWLGLLPAIFADCIVGSILFVYGLANTDLAVGATLSSLAPLLSVPIAILYREESWSLSRFIAVAATVSGAVLLATSGRSAGQ
jgi:drug/metabolite transporter (DMT)-like permease